MPLGSTTCSYSWFLYFCVLMAVQYLYICIMVKTSFCMQRAGVTKKVNALIVTSTTITDKTKQYPYYMCL